MHRAVTFKGIEKLHPAFHVLRIVCLTTASFIHVILRLIVHRCFLRSVHVHVHIHVEEVEQWTSQQQLVAGLPDLSTSVERRRQAPGQVAFTLHHPRPSRIIAKFVMLMILRVSSTCRVVFISLLV